MAHAQIPVWESVFNFTLVNTPNETINLLSKLEFDGEGDISIREHLRNFLCKCNKYNIIDLSATCRLFSLTLKGRIKCWLETFPPNFFFTWFQFAHEFLDTFKDYDSNKICSELQALRRNKGESSEDFSVRLSHILCKFHITDLPSESDL